MSSMTTPTPQSTPGIRPGLGDSYRCRATGLVFFVEGRRSKARSCLIHDAKGPGRQVRDHVTLEELATDYEFLGCDHTTACCDTHGTHTTPHMGCIFR
ncbi:hypothetical protein [Arthrobacter methylotrophus]|uniref:Uncharacterized protein n=2 Tax=Arthrobacter methylotrophus TaxID=121291 RepID=A0ABV5UPH3_9MICC